MDWRPAKPLGFSSTLLSPSSSLYFYLLSFLFLNRDGHLELVFNEVAEPNNALFESTSDDALNNMSVPCFHI
jgi:hypothetical protein